MTIKEILEADNLLELYEQVDLIHSRNAQLFKEIKEYPEASFANIEKKEELNTNNNKLDALTYRINQLKNKEVNLNYNFRMLAKEVLTTSSYKKILRLAELPLSESKLIIKNKIE